MADAPQIDELKELVKVSLQQTGVLCSIKAQLRAAVFKVVNDEQNLKAGNPPPAVMNTSEGALAADLVREFLEYYKLHSSLSVLIPEAGLDQDYPGRHPLAARLGVPDDPGCPLLVRLLSAFSSTSSSASKPSTESVEATETKKQDKQREVEQEATPSPPKSKAKTERDDGPSQTGELGGSPASPGDDTPASMQQSGQSTDAGGSLGTLAGMPSLTGKKSGLGTLAGLPNLGRAGGGGGGFGALPADEDEDEEEEDELTSTTRRMKAAGGSGDASVDRSLEERQNRMLESAAQAELAMKNRTADLAVELSDDMSDGDIVEEEIEVGSDVDAESPSPSPQWGAPAKTAGELSESCTGTEVSVDDRSVDGSMALEAFDHVEDIAR